MIRGESEPPSSFHQPEGIGVGKAPATGCCTPGGNSPQLLKKIAIAVRGRSLTSWIDFMKRGKYAASVSFEFCLMAQNKEIFATLHWTLVPYRTLITQPNSNLRKTFNAFPKQNSDENVQRNGDMRFLF